MTGRQFPENARDIVTAAVDNATTAPTMSELLLAESAGAAAYWSAWRDIPVRFAKKDTKRVPEHWRTFVQRGSPITGSPRLAANPANALLNYLYALLEAETRIACFACGLDPGLGVFHADQRSRDSLALDLMEWVRPQVDSYLLDLLAVRTFTAADFAETRKGVCRVLAPLTHTLAETSTTWAKLVAPVVEKVAHLLLQTSATTKVRLTTPLTQAHRSAGRDGLRRGERKAQTPKPRALGTCRTCGEPVPGGDRQYCDDCLPAYDAERLASLQTAGPAALAKLRAEGRDPSKTPQARRRSAARTYNDSRRRGFGTLSMSRSTRSCSRARYCPPYRTCRSRA